MPLKPTAFLRCRLISAILFSLIFCFVGSLQAQTNTLKGRVTDKVTQAGIPRVSITIQGTGRGVVTDENGNFSIQRSAGDVVVVSSQGYVSREIPANSSNGNIQLTAEARQLSEVVVIGYGQKSRRLLTESISTVAAKDIQKLPTSTADAAIQGRVSGVQITNVDGTPGSPVAVRVRGVGTVGATQPLFVIDGVQVGGGITDVNSGRSTNALATLNPNDIESISVLKDASSIAIYGMRAANGVVLITTKRGKTGKARVTLDSYYGVQNFSNRLVVNNTAQYIALAQEGIDNRNAQDNLSPGQTGYRVLHPDLIEGTPNSVTGINTDWEAATINKNAPISNTNVSISGGTDNASYYFSAGYFTQEAITKNWDFGKVFDPGKFRL